MNKWRVRKKRVYREGEAVRIWMVWPPGKLTTHLFFPTFSEVVRFFEDLP